MNLSQHALRRIVAASRSIDERLQRDSGVEAVPDDVELIAQRRERWMRSAAAGDAEQFERRLRWDGLNSGAVHAALGRAPCRDDEPLPAWTQTLEAVVARAAATAVEQRRPYTALRPGFPVPFEELLVPFVVVAREKLDGEAQAHLSLLSPSAHGNLDYALMERVARVCFRTLEQEFTIFRLAQQQSAFTLLLGQLQGTSSRQLYDEFIDRMFGGQLVETLIQYPVLARLTAQVVEDWVAAASAFLAHLAADLPQIRDTFAVLDPGPVEALQTSLSDPHHHGRSVMIVQFTSGLKLVYKPKDLAAEAHFMGTLAWINARQELLPLRVLHVLDRGAHGWVEFAEAFPCRDAAELARYYRRSGMLLGLVYALRGTDFHYENTLACGEQPVLVDFETLLTPVLGTAPSQGADTALHLAAKQVYGSVLTTGLLPWWAQSPDQQQLDLSGLGAVDAQAVKTAMLRHVNTDNMGLAEVADTLAAGSNSPFGPDMPASLLEYIDDIVHGFREMYGFLLRHREELLCASSPLAVLASLRYRLVYRNTMLYTTLLVRSCRPKLLRDGVERSMALDALSRAFLKSADKPSLWPILAAERQALERLDVPVFTYRGDGTALENEDVAPIPEAFSASGHDAMRDRLRDMDHEDLERQVMVIRGSLYARVLTPPRSMATDETARPAETPLPRSRLLEVASSIGRAHARSAVRAPDGSACWIGMHYDTLTDRYSYRPMDTGLYNGIGGIAVFLAALAKVTENDEWRELALGVCAGGQRTLDDLARTAPARVAQLLGIGAANGIAAAAYALATVGELLEEPALLEAALHTAEWLTDERLQADTHFDVLHGAAGGLLVLLKLHRLTAASSCLDRAITAGNHLVAHHVMDDAGACTWKTTHPKMLTGFAQGAAGIAYALSQLFLVTREPVYRDVVSAAIAYERTAFSPEHDNWHDHGPVAMTNGTPTCMTGWCHGAPGIGLARLAALRALDTDEIRRDIDVALHTTQRAGGGPDVLCCGTAGRIDVLLTAAQTLQRADCHDAAQRLAARMVRRARRNGTFDLYANVPSTVHNPALFHGTAGIGYTLLRLAAPAALPSLLLWE